jgi:hypothetical protein
MGGLPIEAIDLGALMVAASIVYEGPVIEPRMQPLVSIMHAMMHKI